MTMKNRVVAVVIMVVIMVVIVVVVVVGALPRGRGRRSSSRGRRRGGRVWRAVREGSHATMPRRAPQDATGWRMGMRASSYATVPRASVTRTAIHTDTLVSTRRRSLKRSRHATVTHAHVLLLLLLRRRARSRPREENANGEEARAIDRSIDRSIGDLDIEHRDDARRARVEEDLSRRHII